MSRTLDLLRAAATLELPFRSVADCYTSVPLSDQSIPNVVYQTWVEPRLGRRHARGVRRFRRLNPNYSFEFFDDEAMAGYMRERFAGEPILDIYHKCVEGPARTDIWRYCVLLDRGGWYVDINKMIDAPLRQFIAPETRAVISMEQETNLFCDPLSERASARFNSRAYVLNWGLAFEPGHPIMRRVIEGIVAAYEQQCGVTQENLKWAIVSFTGPRRLTNAAAAAIDAGEDEGTLITGADFDGHGVTRIPGAWARALQRPRYRTQKDVVMVR